MSKIIKLFPLIFVVFLSGCDGKDKAKINLQAIDVEDGAECHLCGMYVTRFSGPKGQSYLRRQKSPSHFCSTRDLFSYLLQPDIKPNVARVFVHDMARTSWSNPEHSQQMYIDAETAYYVIGHTQQGAMGHTIASFSDAQSAAEFMGRYGGHMVRYQEITQDTLNKLEPENN
jgi:copper chaperone NosL